MVKAVNLPPPSCMGKVVPGNFPDQPMHLFQLCLAEATPFIELSLHITKIDGVAREDLVVDDRILGAGDLGCEPKPAGEGFVALDDFPIFDKELTVFGREGCHRSPPVGLRM